MGVGVGDPVFVFEPVFVREGGPVFVGGPVLVSVFVFEFEGATRAAIPDPHPARRRPDLLYVM